MKKTILVVLGVIVVIAALGIGIYFIHPFTKGNPPHTLQQKAATGTNVYDEQIKKEQAQALAKKIKVEPGRVHPVLGGFLRVLGGTLDGKWLDSKAINNYVIKGQKYRLYSFDQYLGEFQNTSDSLPDSYDVAGAEFEINNDQIYDKLAFGVAGDWNVFPRKPQLKTDFDHEDPFIGQLLQEKGLMEAKIVIQKKIVADLDGDGTDETLIVASNITKKDEDDLMNGNEKAAQGKYSLIILRTDRNGEEENVVVAGEYNELSEHDIQFVADVDNDGKMEFLDNCVSIESAEAEGACTTNQALYKYNQGKLENVAGIFIMPR
ncbi:MAG TPA: hypothetical protein DDW50_11510 [Firmicutes bacterium]|jgi:hypothetical protein|nr:hypothetical protein [Bacillota bacterium]